MAQGSSPLSRRQLEQILGLDSGASQTEILRAAVRLSMRLERRRESAGPEERAPLDAEIEDLSASVVAFLGSDPSASRPATASSIAALSSSIARERLFLGAILFLATLVIVFFAAWLSRDAANESEDATTEPALLMVESRPVDALLRIRAGDGEAILHKIPGDGVAIEMEPGRYALEVSREDCPDIWSLEIELEPGESRRYDPTICVGAGELVVRSNVSGDRLRIDEIDLGATRAEPHLLGVGDHQVRVEKKGFVPFVGVVRIRPDEKTELRAELTAGSGSSEGGNGGRKTAGEVPLPFEVVAPSVPPGVSKSATNSRVPSNRQVLLPEAMAPDPIRPEQLALPDPVRDFRSVSSGQRLPKGGSTTWHDAVSNRIVSQFDADGSGRIDRASETESIPCAFWKEIERSFDEGRLGLSMSRLYGFDGTEWHPKALGFAREERGLAYERMKACGLAP